MKGNSMTQRDKTIARLKNSVGNHSKDRRCRGNLSECEADIVEAMLQIRYTMAFVNQLENEGRTDMANHIEELMQECARLRDVLQRVTNAPSTMDGQAAVEMVRTAQQALLVRQ